MTASLPVRDGPRQMHLSYRLQSCSAPRAVKALRGFAAFTDKRLLSLRGYNTIVAEATAQDSDWVTQSSIASAEVMANLQSPTATGIFPSLVNVVRGGD